MKEWLVGLRQNPRALYAVGGGAAALFVVGIATLWIAGAFGGEGNEDTSARRDISRSTPTSTRPRKRTGTPTATATTVTPTPSVTIAPGTPIFVVPTSIKTSQPTPPPPPPQPPGAYGLALDVPDGRVERMVDFAMIPGSSDEAVIATQKAAKIWRVSLSGAFPLTPYGDLSHLVGGNGNEEGLLSVTFSPNFQADGRIYVYYTQGGDSDLPTVLSRFQVVNGVMDTANETRILEVPDFASNHNGGRILFGPDGYLYLSTGDGGGGGDPRENGQNPNSLLGKVLRLNVTDQATYSIPPDNPFAGGSAQDDLTYAYGLRNPWRFSFDRGTGELWLGDVGQGLWEEIDRVVKGGNYGWDCYEGNMVYEATGCPAAGFQFPRAVYDHGDGSCAVTGGYVYRGNAIPHLRGRYVYGDFCSGKIWAANTGDNSAPTLLLDSDKSIGSFAELPNGELLILTFDYQIYRLVYG